jgi:hypothetical protein
MEIASCPPQSLYAFKKDVLLFAWLACAPFKSGYQTPEVLVLPPSANVSQRWLQSQI